MPKYDYQCPHCGKVEDVYAGMNETEVPCPKCNTQAHRLFSPPRNIILDLQPYLDENMGAAPVWITSRRQKADELQRRGLVMKQSIGDGYR